MEDALTASLKENGMSLDKEQITDLVMGLWEDAGLDTTTSTMQLSDLRSQLSKHTGLVAGLTKRCRRLL